MAVKILNQKVKQALVNKFKETSKASQEDARNYISKKMVAAQSSGKKRAVEAVHKATRKIQKKQKGSK